MDLMRDRPPLVQWVVGATAALFVACGPADEAPVVAASTRAATADLLRGRLPNDLPIVNEAGAAATHSTAGFVDLENPFHEPQGTNGRSCETCHLVQAGWSIRPIDVELLFVLSRGTHPIFNPLDADNPSPDLSTIKARRAAFGMLRRGLFRRGGNVPAGAEFTVVAVDDPLGAGGTATRVVAFRRPLATANFHIARNVGWHDQNTAGTGNVTLGLTRQVDGNITGAQQGAPATPERIQEIVTYEEGLRFAQAYAFDAGRLDACGARGGPAHLSAQAPEEGRFDLFDAWIELLPGTCTTAREDRARARIARGQELFNAENPGGGSCRGCHDARNNGSNLAGRLFDVGASRAAFRGPGMPLYTLRRTGTGEERQTTDPGFALLTGEWRDVDRFKVPSLRGAVARPPYFHNGIARSLRDVVLHYEQALGFVFTPEEEDDLVAFLEAL